MPTLVERVIGGTVRGLWLTKFGCPQCLGADLSGRRLAVEMSEGVRPSIHRLRGPKAW